MSKPVIEFKDGDEWGTYGTMINLRSGDDVYVICPDGVSRQGSLWTNGGWRPIPNGRAIAEAMGFEVREVKPETEPVPWPTHCAVRDGHIAEMGTKEACAEWTDCEVRPMPVPPPHPTVVELAKAMDKWMERFVSPEAIAVRAAAREVVRAGVVTPSAPRCRRNSTMCDNFDADIGVPNNPEPGTRLIARERRRQIDAEGWDAAHDDTHGDDQMADAAMCYLSAYSEGTAMPDGEQVRWPWERGWWKPKDRISNLVRAGALIAAEIDRLQRLSAAVQKEVGSG